MTPVLISVALPLESVGGKNPLPRDTGPVRHSGYRSAHSLVYIPQHPFTDQSVKKDEQLNKLHADCLGFKPKSMDLWASTLTTDLRRRPGVREDLRMAVLRLRTLLLQLK